MYDYKHILLLGVVLCGKQYLAETNLIRVINDLNKHLNIEWNIVITQQSNWRNKGLNDFLKNAEHSIVLKTSQQNTEEDGKEIYEIFSQKVLTIVFHGGERMHVRYYFQMLAKTLKTIHFTTILWIIDTEQDDLLLLQQISHVCWNYGFVSVLFYHNEQLFTYRPLPHVRVVQLQFLQEFKGESNMANFHQYPLRIPITSSPPRCYRYNDTRGNFVNAGYFYEILILFIQQYNLKFMEYPNRYGADENNELLQDLAANKLDAVPFLAYKNRLFWSSDVLWNVNAVLLVPNAKPIKKFKYFQKPFRANVWILHLLLVLLAAMLIGVVVLWKTKKFDFFKSLLYVLSLALYQNQFRMFKIDYRFSKCVYMFLFLYGFVIVQIYLCKLSSMLVLIIYEPQIKSLQDINSTDYKLFINVQDLIHFISSSTMPPFLQERLIITDGKEIDNKRRTLNASFIHMGLEDKINFFLIQQKFLKVPLVQLIDPVIFTEPVFFTMRHDLPFTQLFNRYLKYLAESGLLQKILKDIEKDGILSGEIRYIQSPHKDADQLMSLEYFYSPLILYAGGVVLAVVVFSLEILCYKLKARIIKFVE